MSEMNGEVGELRFTISIVRKETGLTETYEMVGRTTPEVDEEEQTWP